MKYLKNEYNISEQHGCQVMQINRSSYRYVASKEPFDLTYRKVLSLSGRYSYWGYRKIFDLMEEKDFGTDNAVGKPS